MKAPISPLDDRYQNELGALSPYFTEYALTRYRLWIEIAYLIALSEEKQIEELPRFTILKKEKLWKIHEHFSTKDMHLVKSFEKKTQHDVKALELFFQQKMRSNRLGKYTHFTHFGLTSEDTNNIAYTLQWRDALKFGYLPAINQLLVTLKKLAIRYKNVPLLAMTHGQAATPTTLGKEIAVFYSRLDRQVRPLKKLRLQGKFSGATGTWSAQCVAYPRFNWWSFSDRFLTDIGLEPNLITTQIESHDSLAESYHTLIRINTILTDLCRDFWMYISRGIFSQLPKSSEVGSSTMPHKVNPIRFENAEGNLGVANTLLSHLAQTLPISRMQRDLSGSTTIRNQGVPLAHSLLACKNILKGLERLSVNQEKINQELNDHWEVLSEAIQTVLRKTGDTRSYDRIKSLVMGKQITKSTIHELIKSLKISPADKKALLSLSPQTYTGLASRIVDQL